MGKHVNGKPAVGPGRGGRGPATEPHSRRNHTLSGLLRTATHVVSPLVRRRPIRAAWVGSLFADLPMEGGLRNSRPRSVLCNLRRRLNTALARHVTTQRRSNRPRPDFAVGQCVSNLGYAAQAQASNRLVSASTSVNPWTVWAMHLQPAFVESAN